MSATSIYTQCKKRRGRSKYLLSVTVRVGREERVPAKLVFVRNRNKRSEYLVLICTDISLSEEEIIRLYGKRWDIEVFFKTCKSLLKLEDECNVINLDEKQAYIPILVHNCLEKVEGKTWTDALFSSVFRGYVTLKLMGSRAENLK